jgi:peptidoglycan/LPS O-acetylase OafA/YrhL
MSSAPAEARVFHTLDALRGIAAIGVVVFHMQRAFAPVAAPGGYLAVDLFFMMSGVVISHAYETRFRAGMGLIDFMRARLIRLYPLYLLGTLLGVAVTVASFFGHNIQNWDAMSLAQAVLLALLLLPDLSGRPVNEMFPLNIPCWSLFLEIVVNLLFVVLWPWLSSRRLLVATVLAGGAVAVAIAHQGSIDQGSAAAGVAVGLARTIFGFSLGVLLARHIKHLPRTESDLGVVAIVAVVVIAIAGSPRGEWRAAWDAACVLVVFPLVVYYGTRVDPGARLQRIATFLGVTSYAIYVLHSPLASVMNSATRALKGGGAPYLGLGVLAVLLTGCWLVDQHIDMPVRRWLSRVLPRMPATRATAKTT